MLSNNSDAITAFSKAKYSLFADVLGIVRRVSLEIFKNSREGLNLGTGNLYFLRCEFPVSRLRKHKRQNGNFAFDVKGDDVHLAVDLVSGAYENLYGTAIIVSGDEDFVPAIKKAKKLGKKVINAYSKSTSSTTLKKTCNDYIYMNDLIKENKNCLVLP